MCHASSSWLTRADCHAPLSALLSTESVGDDGYAQDRNRLLVFRNNRKCMLVEPAQPANQPIAVAQEKLQLRLLADDPLRLCYAGPFPILVVDRHHLVLCRCRDRFRAGKIANHKVTDSVANMSNLAVVLDRARPSGVGEFSGAECKLMPITGRLSPYAGCWPHHNWLWFCSVGPQANRLEMDVLIQYIGQFQVFQAGNQPPGNIDLVSAQSMSCTAWMGVVVIVPA